MQPKLSKQHKQSQIIFDAQRQKKKLNTKREKIQIQNYDNISSFVKVAMTGEYLLQNQ